MMKRGLKNSRKRPALSNDQKVLARLFAKGDKRALVAREWAERVMVQGRLTIEAVPGSARDVLLRSALAKQWMGPAEAEELMKMVKATQGSGKPGRPVDRRTLERIQGIAWLRMHEPGLSLRKMVKRMGIDYDDFRTFVRQRRNLIETATKLLEPRPRV